VNRLTASLFFRKKPRQEPQRLTREVLAVDAEPWPQVIKVLDDAHRETIAYEVQQHGRTVLRLPVRGAVR
jgi:hypothetical protein